MSRIAYVNGRYLPLARARVHIEDRGYQFADGVYEVCEVRGGTAGRRAPPPRAAGALAVGAAHRHADAAARRSASCCARWCAATASAGASSICRSPAAWRGATMPSRRPARAPALVVTARNHRLRQRREERRRRRRRDHGAGQPLGARRHQVGVAAAQCARQADGARAGRPRGLVRRPQGFVTEGSSSNAWIVTRDGTLVTRQVDTAILPGITRTVVLDVIAAQGLKLEERPFTVDEAKEAREAFITSASQTVMPVVRIDGRPVGNGAPGLIATALAPRLLPPRRTELNAAGRAVQQKRS